MVLAFGTTITITFIPYNTSIHTKHGMPGMEVHYKQAAGRLTKAEGETQTARMAVLGSIWYHHTHYLAFSSSRFLDHLDTKFYDSNEHRRPDCKYSWHYEWSAYSPLYDYKVA